MMKKIVSFLLFLALLFLCGCAAGTPAETPVPQTAAPSIAPTPKEQVPENAGKVVSIPPSPVQETVTPAEIGLNEVTNILLIGVDNDNLEGMEKLGSADGILLATINTSTEEIVFTSFLRDTRVAVDRNYNEKLTYVYHKGGIDLLRNTMESNFNIPIDYYAIFNYLDIISLVDSVGGLELELNEEEIKEMSGKISNLAKLTGEDADEYLLTPDQAGKINLNGLQTAAYMRIRPNYSHNDFGRTERARKIVFQLLEKAYSMSLPELISFAGDLLSKVQTDISAQAMLSIAAGAEQLKSYSQVSDRIPLDDAYTSLNNGSYLVPNFELTNQHLHDSLYEGKH